jgi:outer membrane protein assembly factor BamA
VQSKQTILCLFLSGLIFSPALTQADRIPLFLIVTDVQPVEEIAVKGAIQPDSLVVRKKLNEVLDNYREDGYLAASIDSFDFENKQIRAFFHRGPRFKWTKVSFDSIDPVILHKAGIRIRNYQNKQIDPQQLMKDQNKLVSVLENSGYPFASAGLYNMRFEGNMTEGMMYLNRGPLIRIDTIIIKGNAKISPEYLQKLIGLEKNDIYREDKLIGISDRIKETTFLREIKPFEIEFRDGTVDIYTYLDKNRANQFNGIIGIIPNNKATGKLLLTGEVNFNLANLFGRGILFGMDWKKLEPFTQELNVSGSIPYLFNSSVGIGMNLFLLKQDTTYFRAEPEVELKYLFNGSDYLRIFYRSQGSSLISTHGLEDITTLPSYADFNTSLYGAGMRFNKLDYLYNPRKGIYFEGDLSIGSKKIKKNPGISDDVYKNLDLSTTKTVFTSGIYIYFPLGRNFVAHIRNLNGYMYNENLFENELFRLGGIRNIRGMDENSVTASSFILGTLEFRYLFEEQSNLFLFFDGGYYQKNISAGLTEDTPFGFGAGMNLQTRAGIFTISYALGRQSGNPVNIGNAKVHIGYIQRF